MPSLLPWQNFYVVLGSAAGALTGLQFIVVTLIATIQLPEKDQNAGRAFATPSVIYFSTVLLLSALMVVPWQGVAVPLLLAGLVGWAGVGYSALLSRLFRRQSSYQPMWEDWVFRLAMPMVSYAVLAAAVFARHHAPGLALGLVAASSLGLLFIGIHHAWDNVNYLVFAREHDAPGKT